MNILRLASYNIRKSVGLDWKRNPSRICEVLAEINADIVVLQEVDKRFFSKGSSLPKELLKTQSYQAIDIAENENSIGWHGNVILFKDPLNLFKTKRISISTLEPRGAVAALFNHPTMGDFQIIGTHLSLLGYMREKQIADLMAQIEPSLHEYPTVIAGDFNEWREHGKAHRAFDSEYEVITPGASYHSALPKLPLDRFVLRGKFEIENYGVHDTITSSKASDHLPIYLDFILNNSH